MSISVPEDSAQRGPKDARRHRDKQREAVRRKLPEIIAEESIITGRKNKKVKIPIRSIAIPQFKPKSGDENYGFGQGKGKPGDKIGHRPAPEGAPGGAGQEPGVDYIETEIEMEEIIEMMLEDLGLPKLEEKTVRQIMVEAGYKLKGRSEEGPWVLLDRKATGKEGFKRFWAYLSYLQENTGKNKKTCYAALKQAKGDLENALALLNKPDFSPQEVEEIEPFPILGTGDLRFHKYKKNIKHQSQAVVLAMMDVSGSMGDEQKYMARSMLFWLVEFLRVIYKNLEVRFIVHDAVAKLVDEYDFFHRAESGGTKTYTAYELAKSLIENEYPLNEWNAYMFHFSDGDDWGSESEGRTMELIRQCIGMGVNMVGYGQIPSTYGSGHLYVRMEEDLPVERVKEEKCSMLVGGDDFPFVAVKVANKESIWPALRAFLKKDRWKPEVAR